MVALHPQLARCSRCRMRWERAAALHRHNLGREEDETAANGWSYGEMLSPIGMIWVATGPMGVVAVETHVDEIEFVRSLEQWGEIPSFAPSRVRHITDQLSAYFAGDSSSFDLELDLSRCTPFVREVLDAVRRVPWGSVRSYGDIALDVGRPGAARAVGSAIASCPVSIVIPCQRIIRADGSLGEYGYWSFGSCGPAIKRALLATEGVTFPGPVHGREGANETHPLSAPVDWEDMVYRTIPEAD